MEEGSLKKVFLRLSQISQEKTCVRSVFNKVYLKETPAQVFSGEICENFKSIYFEKLLWTIASQNTSREAIELSLKVFAF